MAVTVKNEVDRLRYEAHVGADLAGFVDYQLAPDLVVLTHTEVDEAFEGQGVGSALARRALDDVRDGGLKVLIICPFITAWMSKHPEYGDLRLGAPAPKAAE